jgi:hypothetical protein
MIATATLSLTNATVALRELMRPTIFRLPVRLLILSALPAVFGLFAAPAFGQARLNVTSETIIRAFERDTSTQNDASVIPIYEYLQIDYGRPEGDGVSLHINGWGRKDLGDGAFYDDDPEAALLYAYLEYFHPTQVLQMRLGRQQVFNGVAAAESLDGVWVESMPAAWLGFSAYGGLPVALESADDRDGDLTYGGRVFHRLAGRYEVGLSYRMITGDLGSDDERMGVDLFLSLPWGASLNGFSAYNLVTGGWGEHSYEILFNVRDLYFKPYFQRFSYEDFFNSGTISARPFRFLSDSGETLTVIGAEAIWQTFGAIEVGGRYNHYGYDLRQESADFIGGLLNWRAGDFSSGGEIGLMEGDTAENSYWLARAFFYWNRPVELLINGFFTGDAVYVAYDEEVFGKNRSLFLSLGLGRRFFEDRLELRLSGDYSDDPYFDSDLRATVTALLGF